jgi:hypothetical protein
MALNVQEIEQASVFSQGRRDEKLNEQVKIGGAQICSTEIEEDCFGRR